MQSASLANWGQRYKKKRNIHPFALYISMQSFTFYNLPPPRNNIVAISKTTLNLKAITL